MSLLPLSPAVGGEDLQETTALSFLADLTVFLVM